MALDSVRPDGVTASSQDQQGPKTAFGSWAFAFGPFASDPWSFQRVCQYVAEAGYDGIEINGFRPHPHQDDFNSDEKTRRLRAQIDSLGLGISAFAPDMTSAPPTTSSEAVYLRLVDGARAFCERMGITTLRVDSVSPPVVLDNDDYEARFARMAANFTAAAKRLARSGVQLVWEFEPGFWLNSPSEVVRLLKAVEGDNFGVLFDTSHALTSARGKRQTPPVELLEGGAVEYARLLKPWVRHLHLIDSVGVLHDDETSEHLPFGTGEVDFDAVMDELGATATGLDWWTVDYCFWPDTERDGVAGAQFVRDLAARHRRA
ncbi:sugar phosphate isomerase/epimerase family protein [Ornithinimicrobium cryptoxanthini]|uniref:Sugar phosphate isomerase/epimerase n=1 Tax=Ornithinimicrobium cryptoxanthini TaxID=2934161 RepID=A0ABY4YGE6_9MICO|nr:sugar phosphate isomerase/epimerase family protein [Ornithinimicrobium cryptoxanthini]USQ75335.1 sugar phosphate isomerase/epimerase [Ornithinimicrobium cryptoxanthini]